MSSDSHGRRTGGWSGASPGRGGRAGAGRIGADQAATLAARAVRTLDCAELHRLFRDSYALSFHKLDDRTLARRLAQAIMRGEARASDDEDDELAPQWVNLPELDESRALLSTAEIVPGLDRYVIENETQAAEVAGLLLAGSAGREFVLDYLEADDYARDGKTVDPEREASTLKACADLLYSGDLNLHTPRGGQADETVGPVVIAPHPAREADEAQAKDSRTDHWIEIVLKDEDGEPIPDEPYRITLPSGEVRSGTLDAQGKARLDGLKDGGSAQVAFPKIDGREWRLA